MGRVSSVTDSLGHSSFTQYDKAGRKTLETDANGNATTFHYDDAGRLLRVTEASGAETAYTYDRNGNKLTQKDANGNTWSYTYDPLNRLVQEKDPLGRTNSMTYDAIGNLKTKTDGKGQITTYAYNIRRLSTVTYAGGATESFTYDPLGRRIGMSNASVSMAYVYDTLNRITKVTNQTYNHVVNYVYDAAGNISSRSIVADGLAPTFQNRTLTTQYAFDPKNRLTTITDPLAGTFRFGYDPMDRRTSLAYPNGTSTFYEYDKGYRLTALATKGSSGSVIDAWSYQYDAVGNRISKTDMDGKVEGYSYDNTYRLTEARYGDGSRETFTYDPVGNRRTRTDESGTMITYSYDIANQMLTSGAGTFTYDANGNMTAKTTSSGTTTMTYDAANRVSAIGGASGREVNSWAPDGRRAQMTGDTFIFESGQSGGTSIPIHPIYDVAGNPIADGGSGTSILRYRVYGPGIDEPLAEANFVGNISYLHHDALGSITCATNATSLLLYRNRYKAFGTMTYTGTTDINYQTRLSYTSRENSVGGMYQYRSRYYDAGVGRFAQQDSYKGDDAQPPSLHRYVYALNSPVRYSDPNGFGVAGADWALLLGSAILAYVAFVVVSAMLLSAMTLFIKCGGNHDCLSTMLTTSFHEVEFVPIIGFFWLMWEIFGEGDYVNPLDGLMWLMFGALFAWFTVEQIAKPIMAATWGNPFLRGAATIGCLFAAEYAFKVIMRWDQERYKKLMEEESKRPYSH